VVIGASTNPARYSYMAVHRLVDAGHPVIPVGLKKGDVAGIEILHGQPEISDVDTVTLYVGPAHQDVYKEYVRKLNPKRVIFNPGTINPDWMSELENASIEVVNGCTLVMLSIGSF